ncbi:MAG: FAD-dependent oxidoreductase [Pyrinomonadaceae bacterium]
MLTRREILKAFLGSSIAATACKLQNTPNRFDGTIVGASDRIGHILRERRNFEVSDENKRTIETLIVGGGISGLSAAWQLRRKDYQDFQLLELESRFGGTSTSDAGKPVSYPWGAHYLPVPFAENVELVELLNEMGLVESKKEDGEIIVPEQFLVRDPEERIFYKGRWYEGLYLTAGASDKDLQQLSDFQKELERWIAWRGADGKRAFIVPVENCSADSEVTALDKISFAQWLADKGFTSPRLNWYCDYACRDDYGLKLSQTSAWAGLFYFCSRTRAPGEDSQSFITFPEGNGKFVNHFTSKVKDNIHSNALVTEIIPNNATVDVIYLNTKTNTPRQVTAKNVIFASPVFTAPYMIRGFSSDLPFDSKQFAHNAWFVANIFLKDRPKNNFARDFPAAWDNVFYESPSLGYVSATHQEGIDYGATILTYYYPMASEDLNQGRRKLYSLDWKEITDVILSDMEIAHKNIREITTKIDVMRWGHAMISPRTGFMFGGERKKATDEYRGIYFAHSDLGGIAIFEEAFHHGLRAANMIIEKSSQ